MTEKLLQYLWNFKIFKSFDFKDTQGTPLEIQEFGTWNHNSGPDFQNAKVKTKNLVLVGHIELHVKSSDWIFHQHAGDPAFNNIILHAVYFHDTEIEDFIHQNIPTLELKDYIDTQLLWKYEQLMAENTFIPCERLLHPEQIKFGFAEETLLKKLALKSIENEAVLAQNKNNFEALLFRNLAYAFGLKVNAEIFAQIATAVDFSIIQKIRQNRNQLEALFFGIAGWLNSPVDDQTRMWKQEFDFLKAKFGIPEFTVAPKFSRLRPPNFPTLRLSQLAALYHREPHLFSKIMAAEHYHTIFDTLRGIAASPYWNSHYNFGKITEAENEKTLTKDFVDLVIINAVLPLKYTYSRYHSEDTAGRILQIYRQMRPEKNTVTQRWSEIGIKQANALDSQAFLYQYKHYCEKKNCLNCSIGYKLLKASKI